MQPHSPTLPAVAPEARKTVFLVQVAAIWCKLPAVTAHAQTFVRSDKDGRYPDNKEVWRTCALLSAQKQRMLPGGPPAYKTESWYRAVGWHAALPNRPSAGEKRGSHTVPHKDTTRGQVGPTLLPEGYSHNWLQQHCHKCQPAPAGTKSTKMSNTH